MSILSHYRKTFANISTTVWLLSLAMFINRIGSMVLLFASLFFTDELKFSLSTAGIIMSFYGVGSVVGSYFGGIMADKKNYYTVMLISLFGSGLILPLVLFTQNPILLAVIIFSYAFIADMFRPAMSKGIAEYTSPENRTRSVALVRLAINLGFAIGPVVGGLIATNFGYKPLMIIDGITSISAGIMLLIFVPQKSISNKQLQEDVSDNNTSAFKDKYYMIFILMVTLYGTCFFQLFASVPQYLTKVYHYTDFEMSVVLGLNGLLVVLIEMPLIMLIENKKSLFTFIVLGAICTPLAFVILILGQGFMPVIIFYTLIITMSEILAMPFMFNFSISRPGKSRQGQYSALYSIAFGIANGIAPAIGLTLADQIGFEWMYVTIILLGIANIFGFLLLKSKIENAKVN